MPCINTGLHFSSRQDPNIFLGYVINEFIEQENKIPPTRNISKLDEKIPKSIKIVQVLVFFIDDLFIMTKKNSFHLLII